MNPVPRQQVKSSNIKSAGHCPDCNHLYVEFKDKRGNPTRLYKIPATAEEFRAWMNAPSIGTYYYQHFRSRDAVLLNN